LFVTTIAYVCSKLPFYLLVLAVGIHSLFVVHFSQADHKNADLNMWLLAILCVMTLRFSTTLYKRELLKPYPVKRHRSNAHLTVSYSTLYCHILSISIENKIITYCKDDSWLAGMP
jgi:hypothetical protein